MVIPCFGYKDGNWFAEFSGMFITQEQLDEFNNDVFNNSVYKNYKSYVELEEHI